MDDFKIKSDEGSEYEFSNEIPKQSVFEKLHGSVAHYVHGPWGEILFQQTEGNGVALWYSQYHMKVPITLLGTYNKPVTELHSSIENHFISDWEGIGLPTEKQDEGGFSHSPYFDNKAFFPFAGSYKTFDFHFSHEFLEIYSNAYPKLYMLIDGAENKNAGQIDRLMRIDADMKVIINQLIRDTHVAKIKERHFLIKSEEFLMNALDKMHSEKIMKQIKITNSMDEKAVQLESILKERFADPLTLAEIAKMLATNVQSIGVAFKQRHGMTIFKYLKELRFERAKQLLLDCPGLSLESIAIDTQFYDAARLCNAFKKKFGVTPVEFRISGRI